MMTAIAAAVGFASSTPTATTWAAFVPATTDDRIEDLFDAFSSREPVPPPDQVRGHASFENALIVDPASGAGASSTPCCTRPARLSPRAGQPFPVDLVDQGDVVPAGCH